MRLYCIWCFWTILTPEENPPPGRRDLCVCPRCRPALQGQRYQAATMLQHGWLNLGRQASDPFMAFWGQA